MAYHEQQFLVTSESTYHDFHEWHKQILTNAYTSDKIVIHGTLYTTVFLTRYSMHRTNTYLWTNTDCSIPIVTKYGLLKRGIVTSHNRLALALWHHYYRHYVHLNLLIFHFNISINLARWHCIIMVCITRLSSSPFSSNPCVTPVDIHHETTAKSPI